MKKAGPKGFVKVATRRSAASVALRMFVAAALFASALLVPFTTSQASNPKTGSVEPVTGSSVTWRGTAPGGASPEGETTCVEGVNCDTYTLTLNGTPEQWAGKKVKVTISWTLPASDYDFYIHKGSVTGPEVDHSGEAPPVISESAEIDPATAGTGVFAVRVVYWAAAGTADQYTGTAAVENKNAGGAEPTPPPVSTAQPPTYQIHTPPSTLGQRAGEPTIGLNWATGNAMFIASLQTLKVSFDDSVSPATSTWTNVSAPNTSVTSFDPILFTDPMTNRTFVSQLLPTKVSLMSFTDNDGQTWTPSQGAGINSGVDHQTVGGGPYARNADGSLKGGAIQRPGADGKIYPNAVYYASQDIGVAEIARSDDGGLTFGVAVPMYDITQCGGLHGQIKVAPDGTVYVPNKSCGGEQAVVVSEDNGLTWTVRRIPGSTSGRTDPSVGIGTDGTIYVGYANGDGTARAAVSRDRGRTWENDQNIGFHLGVKNTVFPAATAGDGDRAAVFFLGSTTPGAQGTGTDQTAPYFDGQWYGFIATTYDRGRSWVTVNATPNDPIQRGVICTNGTTCPSGTRNLLDFNDMEIDKQGRVLAAVADGCVTASCVQGVDKDGDGRLTRFDNDGARRATIIRQGSGLSLFAAFDPAKEPDPEPVVTTTYIDEDDARVEYSNGWHKEDNFAGASGGHFRHNNGKDAAHFARLNFEVEGETGAITFHYGTSQRGNSAELFLDGVSKGVVSFRGLTGGTKTPVFGPSVTFDGLSRGQHTLELRAINGSVYVDGFTLKSATSSARPSAGPGQTTSGTGTAAAGGSLLSTVNVPEGAQALSVTVGTSLDVPVQVVLIDPNGLTLATVNGSDGVAVINRTVTQAGSYQLKVVNLGLGPVEVWTAATPLVAR